MPLTPHEYGKICRVAFIKDLPESWGELIQRGSWILSRNANEKILTRYSKLHNNDNWWFGINENDWCDWDSKCWLTLIMRDGVERSYLMLNPTESKILIDKLNIVQENSKEIHIKIPTSGKIYIQEWSSFACQDRIKNLSSITQEEINAIINSRRGVGDENLL
jgi:hypothetical protein